MSHTNDWEVRSVMAMLDSIFPPRHPDVPPTARLTCDCCDSARDVVLVGRTPYCKRCLETAEVTPVGQVFFPQYAYALFPRGCQCPDRSGSCDWCRCYYNGPEYAIATSPVEVA